MTEEIINKIRDGREGDLSDSEVISTVEWYLRLNSHLRLLGVKYYLAYNAIEGELSDIQREGYNRGIIEPPF